MSEAFGSYFKEDGKYLEGLSRGGATPNLFVPSNTSLSSLRRKDKP